jgi:ABC-type uncharacterized transport system involved in gliding motility auxiliary subunit
MNAKTGKSRAFLLLVLSVAVVAAAALVLDRFNFKLDLTSRRSHSLSAVSRNLYKELPDTLRITYYVSPELASRHPGPRAIEDFLYGLAGAGRGKISVEVADPSREAGALEGLGLTPQRMQVVEGNEQRIAVVYSGLVLQYRDKTDSIPFAIGTDGLEYGIVKAARRLSGGGKPVVSVIVGDADKAWANDYRSLQDALSQSGWELRQLAPGDPIPAETAALLVLGNSGMDDYAAYRVDAYLAGGGTAFLALRGVDVNASTSLTAAPLKEEALLKAVESYGVKVQRELVLDSACLTVPFQDVAPSGGASIRYVRYPHWISVSGANCDRQNAATANLAGLDLFWPSPLTLSPPPGVKAEVLMRTGKGAWLQTKNFAIGPQDEAEYDTEAPATTGQYNLAASLSGVLPMAYAGKPIPVKAGAPELPPLPAAARSSRLVILGSADFANDLMTMTNSTFNATFAANMTEWLVSGNELAALKARATQETGFDKVADPASRALRILFAYLLNIVLVPGGLVVYGLLRSRKRKLAARVGVEAPAAETQAPEPPAAETKAPNASEKPDGGEK